MESLSVDDMYGDWPISEEDVDEHLNRTLNPRPSSSLFDTMKALGLTADANVLDIGARDARYSITLHELVGCRVTAIDPVERHISEARRLVTRSGFSQQIDIKRGRIEDIPSADESFDAIFCRDVLSHISDLNAALGECHRVLASDASMVIYQTFATELLEPVEKARLCADLAVVPESLDPERLENTAIEAGFIIEHVDIIGSEWRETWEEDGSRRTSIQLLQAARLIRGHDHLRAALGELLYRVEISNALWGVYQMIGKLEPRVYMLRKP